MTLYKRREFALQLPNGKRVLHFQAADASEAAGKAVQLAAENGIGEWELWRDSEATYTLSVYHRSKRHCVDTEQRDRKLALEFAKRYTAQLRAGRLEDLRKLSLRRVGPTMGEIIAAFDQFALTEGIAPGTRRGYVNSWQILLRGAKGKEANLHALPLSEVTRDLAYAYKQAVAKAAIEEDDERQRQMERTANSVLRQAKGLFSARALEHYRIVSKLEIPAEILGFRDAPGFGDTKPLEYHLPSDHLLAATFEDLEKKKDTDRSLYLAVWLAIGFGLRKSEAAAVRKGWFSEIRGRTVLELKRTNVPGRAKDEKTTTKNNTQGPIIECTNGAWEKIAPLLQDLAPDDYVLREPTDTARVEEVFRRVSLWMAGLGWKTEKMFHEWRAYAGCQVARRDGIEAASQWLRHSSILQTQRHYGRYLKSHVSDAPLQIPKPAQFEPKILSLR